MIAAITNPPRSERGLALVMVLLMVLILTLLSLSFLQLSGMETQITQNSVRGMRAYFIAEAGAAQTVWCLKKNAAFSGYSTAQAFDSGTFTSQVTVISGSEIEVASVGLFENAQRTLLYRIDPSTININGSGC